MREKKEDNDLFYTCSLIEYIARITNNQKKDIINKLGKKNIFKIYELADIYHSDNIDKVATEFITSLNIKNGNYNLNKYQHIPSHFDIGKVYSRLIIMLCSNNSDYYIDTLIEVMSSWLINHIDNYDSSLYYESPSYIYACYKEGKII